MTEEEFYALPPEQQMALMQQMEKSQEMKIDYGAMKTPYGVSSDRKSAPPPQGRRQRQSLPPRQGGGGGGSPPGMNTLTKQFGKKLGAAPASGAGSALTATEAAAFVPATAPSSLAVGGGAAVPQVGTAVAGNVGSGAAASGGAGGGSMLASAGPWAALAAAIAINENDAREHGRRDEDMGSYATDLFSGAVLEQDAEAWGDKIGGPLGEATEFMGEMGNPEGILKNAELLFRPDELWDKWF